MEAHDGGGRPSNFDISHAAATYYTDFASLGIGRASPSLSAAPALNGPCCNHNYSTMSPAQSPHNMPYHNQYNHNHNENQNQNHNPNHHSHIHQNGHHQNSHHSHHQMNPQQSSSHPYLSHQKSRRRGSSMVSDQSSYEFLYAEVKSSGSGKRSGNGLLGGALACLCRPKDSSSSSSNPAAETLNSKQLAAGVEDALLQQSRIQMEALAATEETRDMWEWQMEQQQALAMAEHEFLEKRYSCASASAAGASPLYDLARSSSSARRSSVSSLRGGAIAGALLIETLSRNASLRVQGISGSQTNNQQSNPTGQMKPPNSTAQNHSQGNTQIKTLNRGGGGGTMNDPDSPMSSSTPSTSSSAVGGGGGVPEITICRHHLTDPDFLSAATLLFEAALLRCRSEINVFCRIYMQQMVLSGHGLIKTLMDMEPETVFCRKVHASYALESRICSAMFRNFENDSFNDSGLTQILDAEARAVARLQEYLAIKGLEAEEALAVNSAAYDAAFHHFCAGKSEEIAAMFGWTLSYRSAAERDRFMDAFLRAAKCVWMLHRLANSTNPPMQIIRVGRGMEMHPLYVEPVIALPPNSSNNNSSNSNSSSLNNRTHHHHSSNSSSSSSQYHTHHHPSASPTICPNCPLPKVEFMIMPGFVAPKCIFKAKVYQHFVCKSACTPHHLL